ncbi:MAG: glycosyltransferase family 39 protein [Thermoleophilaceae bacterium]|nr:glycosyltransferase family 39 protein [Thermoleophilaceae bacterium]
MTKPVARDLLILTGLALLLRVGWCLLFGRTEPGGNDTIFYQSAAFSLAEGRGYATLFGEPTAHWPPGFPFIVSLAYRAFGNHPWLALGLNVVLSTAAVPLVYLVAARIQGLREARIAGTAMALFPAAIFFTGLWLAETTYITMLVAFLALVVYLPERRWTPVVLGVAVGVAALTKGEGLLLLAIPLAAWWSSADRGGWARKSAVLLVCTGLTIVPWTIRNALVMDSFVPVATNASTTLWSGHNDQANGGATYAPPSLLAQTPKDASSPERELAEARILRREAVRWAVRNPDRELALIPKKLVALNGNASNVFGIWFNAGDQRQVGTSSMLFFGVLADAFSHFLLFAALASLVLLRPSGLTRLHPAMRGVLAYLAVCLVVYGFVYYGQFRYRLPMEPLMILVAAPLLARAWALRGALRGNPAPPGP